MLLFVTVVAIAWAQTAGIHRGYLCECGGTPQVTLADHCHGPDDDACHDHGEAEALPCGAGHGGCEETHDHPEVKEKILARQSSVIEPVFAQSVWATIWVPRSISDAALATVCRPALPTDYPGDPPRRWPALLAHTIELRI